MIFLTASNLSVCIKMPASKHMAGDRTFYLPCLGVPLTTQGPPPGQPCPTAQCSLSPETGLKSTIPGAHQATVWGLSKPTTLDRDWANIPESDKMKLFLHFFLIHLLNRAWQSVHYTPGCLGARGTQMKTLLHALQSPLSEERQICRKSLTQELFYVRTRSPRKRHFNFIVRRNKGFIGTESWK